MTNEQLKMFAAVVEHGSFRGAAKALSKTQSTISMAVKSLEDEFQMKLFDRDTYRPKLTPSGQAFYQHAIPTLEQFETLHNFGCQMAAGVESEFHIVINGISPLPELLGKIKTVMGTFPHTAFKVSTEILGGVLERLDEGDADIAIAPAIGIENIHETVAIDRITFVNVCAPGYITHEVSGPIPQNIIRQYTQIVIRDTAKKVPKTSFNVISGGRSWSVNDYATKKELTIAGLGWGLMPEHLIKSELENRSLMTLDVDGIPTSSKLPLLMVRLRNRSFGPVAERVWCALADS